MSGGLDQNLTTCPVIKSRQRGALSAVRSGSGFDGAWLTSSLWPAWVSGIQASSQASTASTRR
jgi:hypothetical protein